LFEKSIFLLSIRVKTEKPCQKYFKRSLHGRMYLRQLLKTFEILNKVMFTDYLLQQATNIQRFSTSIRLKKE